MDPVPRRAALRLRAKTDTQVQVGRLRVFAHAGPCAERAFALFYVAVLLMWFAGARMPAWLAVADWFRRQPLT